MNLFSNENMGETWVVGSYCWLFPRRADCLWDSYNNGPDCTFPVSSSNISRVFTVLDISTMGNINFLLNLYRFICIENWIPLQFHPWREILQENRYSESLPESKSYSSTTSHQTPLDSEVSTSCFSHSRDLLLGETNLASGTNEENINNMITLKNNMQISKYKINELKRAFLAEENEVVTSCW